MTVCSLSVSAFGLVCDCMGRWCHGASLPDSGMTVQVCGPLLSLYKSVGHSCHCTSLWATLVTVQVCGPLLSLYKSVGHSCHCTSLWATLVTVQVCGPLLSLYKSVGHSCHCSSLWATLVTVPVCGATLVTVSKSVGPSLVPLSQVFGGHLCSTCPKFPGVWHQVETVPPKLSSRGNIPGVLKNIPPKTFGRKFWGPTRGETSVGTPPEEGVVPNNGKKRCGGPLLHV